MRFGQLIEPGESHSAAMLLPYDRSQPLHLAVRYRMDSVVTLQALARKFNWMQRWTAKLSPYVPVYAEAITPPPGPAGAKPPPAALLPWNDSFQWGIPRG